MSYIEIHDVSGGVYATKLNCFGIIHGIAAWYSHSPDSIPAATSNFKIQKQNVFL